MIAFVKVVPSQVAKEHSIGGRKWDKSDKYKYIFSTNYLFIYTYIFLCL